MAKPNTITPASDEAEYRVVRRDLTFVIIMNLVFFAGLLALYFVNRSGGSVDSFFNHLLEF